MTTKHLTSCHGLTLIELLCTLSICAIVLACGIPSLSSFFADNRMAVRSQQLAQSLAFARSEAIQRNSPIVLCSSESATGCDQTSNWQRGWLVFDDHNGNGIKDNNEAVLRHQQSRGGNLTITSTRRTPVVFYANGKSTGSNATFTFCDERGAEQARAVILSNSGRYRISTARSDGGLLTCP